MAHNHLLHYTIIEDEHGDEIFAIETKSATVHVQFHPGCLSLWNENTKKTGKVHACWDESFLSTLNGLLKKKKGK